MRLTPCECSAPGWCARHGCHKPDLLFQLCQRNRDLYEAWEAGQGPCVSEIANSADQRDTNKGPGLPRRVLNFGLGVMRHVAGGLRRVDQATYDGRLAICANCPSCNLEHWICRERSCGCFLKRKAWWASQKCPLEKWSTETVVDCEGAETPHLNQPMQ